MGGGHFAQCCVQPVGFHQRQTQVQVIGRQGLPGSYNFLELLNRFDVFALLEISFADVAEGLNRGRG